MNTGFGACLAERLHDPSGHRADVGTPMPADLRLVTHAAERDADEFAVHGAGDRLSERGLPDARGADEAEDRPLHVAFELPDGEILDDPFLHLVQIVVILVEHAPRFDGVQTVVGRHAPWDVEQPVHVRAEHLVLGRRRRHPREAIHLAIGDGEHGLGQIGLLHPRSQPLDFVAFALAELVLDRLQLLPEVVLPLRVGHLLLRLRLDLALHFEQRDLAGQRLRHHLQLREQRVGLEQPLLLVGRHVEQAAKEIRQAERIFDGRDDAAQLLGEAAGEGQRAVDLLLQPSHVRVHFDGSIDLLGLGVDHGAHRQPRAADDVGAHAREALDNHVEARRVPRHLPDDPHGADPLHLIRPRIVELALLQHQQQHAITAERAVHRFH